jgi:hypothetical protein
MTARAYARGPLRKEGIVVQNWEYSFVTSVVNKKKNEWETSPARPDRQWADVNTNERTVRVTSGQSRRATAS